MRLISWNVANRVKKLPVQARTLMQYEPDFVALQELTATTIPLWRNEFEERGYYAIASFDFTDDRDERVGGRKYSVLTASRWPLKALAPSYFDIPWPERVLSVIVHSPYGAVECHNAHLPAGVSHGWIKIETFEGIYDQLCRAGNDPRILCGDFNSPQEELTDGTTIPFGTNNERWSKAELSVITGLGNYGLKDVYRLLHGFEKREVSWVMWNRGKKYGRRFDHVFASQRLNPSTCTYLHEFLEQGLSDHAPIEVCFRPE